MAEAKCFVIEAFYFLIRTPVWILGHKMNLTNLSIVHKIQTLNLINCRFIFQTTSCRSWLGGRGGVMGWWGSTVFLSSAGIEKLNISTRKPNIFINVWIQYEIEISLTVLDIASVDLYTG